MANIIEITIKGVDKTSAVFKKTEKATKGFQDALLGMTKAAGGAAAVAVILKKSFDLGRAGGVILQTAESFEFLIEKVGATPDLLDQLTEASRGTIGEQKLMAGTMTLLAGASGELATELANQTPRLLEIAKAANKLNPALGDTAFMYQSIATGVKRAQPLILDNLGLTLKVGKANEEYAKKLGKTVEQLTAEEKQLAILNATLEAGDVLIEQVGGSTESATDSFDQLAVIVEEAGDSLKLKLYPILLDAVEALKLMVTWSDQLNEALMENEERVRITSESYKEYRASMNRAAEAAHHWTITTDELTKAQDKGGIAAFLASKAVVVMTEATWEASRSTETAANSMEIWRVSTHEVGIEVENLKESIEDLTETQLLGLAVDAMIAGDFTLAQHYMDLATETELFNEQMKEAIALMDAQDGRTIDTEFIRRFTDIFTTQVVHRRGRQPYQPSGGVGAGGGTITFRGRTFNDAYWSGDTLMVGGQVYGTYPGRRHSGGPVSAGMPYLVGRRGAEEVFIPDQAGRVEPISERSVGLGVTQTIIIENLYERADLEEMTDYLRSRMRQ